MEVDLKRKLEHLLDSNLIEKASETKLKINGKGRIYNPSKPPSEILIKVVHSLYKKQFPKESKPTRRIRNVKDAPPNSANVLLKFDKHGRVEEIRVEDSGVVKPIFNDFIKDFDDSQNNKRKCTIRRIEV